MNFTNSIFLANLENQRHLISSLRASRALHIKYFYGIIWQFKYRSPLPKFYFKNIRLSHFNQLTLIQFMKYSFNPKYYSSRHYCKQKTKVFEYTESFLFSIIWNVRWVNFPYLPTQMGFDGSHLPFSLHVNLVAPNILYPSTHPQITWSSK